MNWLYLKNLLYKLYNSATDNLITQGILTAWAYFGGIHLYIYLVFGLIVFDCVTGIIASRRKGEPFTSKILKKGLIEKTFLYLIMLVAVFFLEIMLQSIFPWDKFYFVFIVSVIISTYELVSIFENVLAINPNLKFIQILLRLSNKLNDKTIESAEKGIEDLTGDSGHDQK